MPSNGFGTDSRRWAGIIGAVGLIIGLAIGYFFGSTSPGLLTSGDTAVPDSSAGTAAGQTQVQLVNHIQADLPEQDVFVEMEPGSDQVVRPDIDQAEDLAASELFAASAPAEHDPFKVGENPLGPFSKGDSLGFTLGDWLAADGSGSYTVDGATAQLELSMERLVPNGVYTVWCSKIKLPPEPLVIDVPCGALDGSDNSFTADEAGAAQVSISMSPLQPSTETVVNALALAYHSDGQTFGPEPGPFGSSTHVQLFFLMPPLGE
ncbi:MAG: hypothetical protein COU69_02730 [Candidatus Pacebacteria bacterium CG10_big_fil_rev_8_21_14_0_10_56_10]|nr:MAG: hypothetical protein COU69_02730 [Candidatus Pacebacteria bacterium CG10_big_fil_rev_8_21_14_0_10_56_10]